MTRDTETGSSLSHVNACVREMGRRAVRLFDEFQHLAIPSEDDGTLFPRDVGRGDRHRQRRGPRLVKSNHRAKIGVGQIVGVDDQKGAFARHVLAVRPYRSRTPKQLWLVSGGDGHRRPAGVEVPIEHALVLIVQLSSTCDTPCRSNNSSQSASSGVPRIGTRHFGTLFVIGLNRRPSPAASRNAFTTFSSARQNHATDRGGKISECSSPATCCFRSAVVVPWRSRMWPLLVADHAFSAFGSPDRRHLRVAAPQLSVAGVQSSSDGLLRSHERAGSGQRPVRWLVARKPRRRPLSLQGLPVWPHVRVAAERPGIRVEVRAGVYTFANEGLTIQGAERTSPDASC